MGCCAILNFQNTDLYCFLWSTLAHLHAIADLENDHATKVSIYRQCFNELKHQGFVFTNGLKCSDVHKLENLNILFINIFELGFYQDQNTCKLKRIPIEASKHDSDRATDLLIYENHYVLFKKLHILLGNQNSNFVFRRCLNSYPSQKVLIKPEQI